MQVSSKPQVVGNILPILDLYSKQFTEFKIFKNNLSQTREPSIALQIARTMLERTKFEIIDTCNTIQPGYHFNPFIHIIASGEADIFSEWHADEGGLALASSDLVTEFLVGEYEPQQAQESNELFSQRIDRALDCGNLTPVTSIETGDIILSGTIDTPSALHRSTLNTTGHEITRILVTGSQNTIF